MDRRRRHFRRVSGKSFSTVDTGEAACAAEDAGTYSPSRLRVNQPNPLDFDQSRRQESPTIERSGR